MKSEFTLAVSKIIKAVPKSQVVSYGQVAAYVGVPRAARQVGWILRQAQDKSLPWWRVVNNVGKITIKGNMFHDAVNQRELLRREDVEVDENFKLEMKKYRYSASIKQMKDWGLNPEYLNLIWNRFSRDY